MKYEEIEVGESYKFWSSAEKAIYKIDQYRVVITIDEDGGVSAWNEEELESFQPIKKELPESGLLVFGSSIIVYRAGEKSGFGFNSFGRYVNNDFWSFSGSSDFWRTATPEDTSKFVKLLEAEAEKRGLGVDAKLKGHADNLHGFQLNGGQWESMFKLDVAWNKNGQIFHNGIWAEPLTILDEVCDTIKKHLPSIVIEMTDGVVTLKQL